VKTFGKLVYETAQAHEVAIADYLFCFVRKSVISVAVRVTRLAFRLQTPLAKN